MSRRGAARVLRGAERRLAWRGWTQSRTVNPFTGSVCVGWAISCEHGGRDGDEAREALDAHLGMDHVGWNDGHARSGAQVRAKLRAAADALEPRIGGGAQQKPKVEKPSKVKATQHPGAVGALASAALALLVGAFVDVPLVLTVLGLIAVAGMVGTALVSVLAAVDWHHVRAWHGRNRARARARRTATAIATSSAFAVDSAGQAEPPAIGPPRPSALDQAIRDAVFGRPGGPDPQYAPTTRKERVR